MGCGALLPRAYTYMNSIIKPANPMLATYLSTEDPQLLISIRKRIAIDDFYTLPSLFQHVKEFIICIDTTSPLSHIQQRPVTDESMSDQLRPVKALMDGLDWFQNSS